MILGGSIYGPFIFIAYLIFYPLFFEFIFKLKN